MREWKGECFEAKDAELAAGLGPDDPRRQHVESCARCGSLVAAYRSFAAAHPAEGAGEAAAAARLDAFLRREVLGQPATAARPRLRLVPALSRVRRSAGRVGLAAAAVMLVLGGAWLLQTGADRPGDMVLRGAATGSAAGPEASVVLAADGGLELRWSPVAEATSYEVRILDARLELRRRLPAPQAVLVLPAWTLAELEGAPRPLLVQVAALAGEDEIAAGAPVPLAAAETAEEGP